MNRFEERTGRAHAVCAATEPTSIPILTAPHATLCEIGSQPQDSSRGLALEAPAALRMSFGDIRHLTNPQLSMNVAAIEFGDLGRRVQPPEGLRRENWDQHPNGGGWVERTATVEPTAFVGPNAIVMDDAQVLGFAKIEGEATVGGDCVVADRAVVTDRSRVNEMARVLGSSRVSGNASVEGYAVLRDHHCHGKNLRPRTKRARTLWHRSLSFHLGR